MDGALGADVSDLDVRSLDAAGIEAIRAALLEYHVLALRDQQLDPAALTAFAAKLGEPEVYPFAQALPGHPYVVPVIKEPEDKSNFGGIWHTDSSYLPQPPSLTLLYAVLVPKTGGDTLFADMHAAYQALPPALRTQIDSMSAQYTASLVHDDGGALRGRGRRRSQSTRRGDGRHRCDSPRRSNASRQRFQSAVRESCAYTVFCRPYTRSKSAAADAAGGACNTKRVLHAAALARRNARDLGQPIGTALSA